MGRIRAVSRRALVTGLLVCCAVPLWPARPAAAHAVLMHTDPGAGAVLPTAPAEVRLRFSEPVRPVPEQTSVLRPDGGRADTGTPTQNGPSLLIRLATGLSEGTYRVTYRVVSDDGHPMAGGFSFSIGKPSPVSGAGVVAPAGATVDPVVAAIVPVVRYLGFVGLILVAGPVLFLAALWPRRLSSRAPLRLALAGCAALVAATVAELYLQAPYGTGHALFSVSTSDITGALSSRVGLALLARLGAVVVGVPLLYRLPRADAGQRSRWAFAAVAVLGLVTWPLSGHAGSSTVPELTLLTDTVHVAAMAVWLGGLVVLLALVLRRADHDELGSLLPVWSRWALIAVAALGTAGLIQAVVLVGSWTALLHTRYGALLLAKAAVFAVIVAAAAVARSAVRGTDPARPRLRRAVATELTLAALVLGLTAVLVQAVPARNAQAQIGSGHQVTVGTAIGSIRLEVAPARPGQNTVRLAALDPDGAALTVLTWFASAALPSRGLAPITVPLRPLAADQAAGVVNLPVAGAWRFRVALRVAGKNAAEPGATSVTATVRVT